MPRGKPRPIKTGFYVLVVKDSAAVKVFEFFIKSPMSDDDIRNSLNTKIEKIRSQYADCEIFVVSASSWDQLIEQHAHIQIRRLILITDIHLN